MDFYFCAMFFTLNLVHDECGEGIVDIFLQAKLL